MTLGSSDDHGDLRCAYDSRREGQGSQLRSEHVAVQHARFQAVAVISAAGGIVTAMVSRVEGQHK